MASSALLQIRIRWFVAALLLTALSLAGCSGGGASAGSSITPPASADPGAPSSAASDPGAPPTAPPATTTGGSVAAKTILVQGNVVGDAAAALTGAPLPGNAPVPGTPSFVPLTAPITISLVDETGSVAASQTVSAADGNFALVASSGHTYILLFADAASGRTIGPLMVDRQTGRVSFSLASDSNDLNFASITIDSQLGKAWCWTDPIVPLPTAAIPVDSVPWRGTSNIPTDGTPSPLFGAVPFTQKMLLFEEFGPEPMPAAAASGNTPFPQPVNSKSGPNTAQLEAFLAQEGLAPFPTRTANVSESNPWKAAIESYLGRALSQPPIGVPGPAEGRPPGEDWAHQRWDDLYPQKYFVTAQAPARVNGGFRDAKQRHGYSQGEFGPGGLYHNTAGFANTEGTTKGIAVRIHPNMPLQSPNSVWTFDGTLPPKLLQARYGEPVMMRHYNALPIDETANNGFGRHTITTHEHNGHSPAESDGFAGSFYFPGEFYDYRWPLQLAGFSNNNNDAGAINGAATDPRAAIPCEAGESLPVLINGVSTVKSCVNGRINIPGDYRETMSTHWFHDHMLDYTAQNVYKGNAVMMNYYSALDRGNEAINDGVNLRFPSGSALSWGNRDYDVNLLFADKAWDANGQLGMNIANHDGFLGDQLLVNWQWRPYLEVRARQYRMRILNGSVSRILALALVQEVAGSGGELPGPAGSGVSYNRIPFYMIANDGNILEHSVPFDGKMDLMNDGNPGQWKGQLPAQGIAERYDIVIDFSKNGIQPGDKLYFVNIMEHQDGKGTKGKVPLGDILSGKYNPVVSNSQWINGDPACCKVLELRVKAYSGTDLSMNPADYVSGKASMIPLAIDRHSAEVKNARHHTFEFVRSNSNGGHGTPWQIKVDGGDGNTMDPHRVSVIQHGDIEAWQIKGTGGWTHPVHIHFEEGIILSRGGKAPPEWEKWARKDMYRVGPEAESTGVLEIAYRARDFLGDYVEHCHNTIHEDNAMLLRWDARNKNTRIADTPMPTFDGVFFEPSFALPLADTGDGVGPKTTVP